MKITLVMIGFSLLLGLGSAKAEPFDLTLPLDCDVGIDCWFVNYVDRDPSPGVRDFGCGSHGYDGHKGVDIAIRDTAEMAAGIEVKASVAGVVVGVRDGTPDGAFLKGGQAAIDGKECGNGILARHTDGWETQYCHLKRGSVVVAKGQAINRGDVLGLVGLSGRTQFPHIHLSVRKDGKVVDPFVGLQSTHDTCSVGAGALWVPEVLENAPYPPTDFYAVGFTDKRPSFSEINAGQHTQATLPTTADLLIFYAAAYWVKKDDVFTLIITGPNGVSVANSSNVLEKQQARRFAFAGKRRPGAAWPAGPYTGTSTLIRGDTTYTETQTVILVPPPSSGGADGG